MRSFIGYFTVCIGLVAAFCGHANPVRVVSQTVAPTNCFSRGSPSMRGLGAVTSYVLTNFTITYERNAQIVFCLLGGLEDRSWEHVAMASAVIPCAAPGFVLELS
jgi:ABC-type Fe3+-siderophore transport system permease subunit